MKQCNKCKILKEETEFARKGLGRSTICKECKRLDNKNYYNKNRDDLTKYARKYRSINYEQTRKVSRIGQQRLRVANRQQILSYLESHPCVDCGESDPIVLQFDHVRGVKSFNICVGYAQYKWETVYKEIQKCAVRCANCHMRKTAKDQNWYQGVKVNDREQERKEC